MNLTKSLLYLLIFVIFFSVSASAEARGLRYRGNFRVEAKRLQYEKFCNNGSVISCLRYAHLSIINKKYGNALNFAIKGCNLKDTMSCIISAWLYVYGRNVKVNVPQSLTYLNNSCDLKDFTACAILGDLYIRGSSRLADYVTEKSFLKKFPIKQRGHYNQLYVTDLRFKMEDNFVKEPHTALFYYQKACDYKLDAALLNNDEFNETSEKFRLQKKNYYKNMHAKDMHVDFCAILGQNYIDNIDTNVLDYQKVLSSLKASCEELQSEKSCKVLDKINEFELKSTE
jgi:hypothetical protein